MLLVGSLRSRNFAVLLLAAGSSFVFFNPFILLSFKEFLRDFSYEQHHVETGHLGINASQTTLGYYLFDALPHYLGWMFCGFFVLALVFGFIRRNRTLGRLLLFPILYFLVLSSWEMRAERYLLPIVPVILLAAAWGIFTVWEWMRKRLVKSGMRLAFAAGVVALFILTAFEPARQAIEFNRVIGLPNTRTIARLWIEEHLPRGACIATGPFGIQLAESVYTLIKIPFRVVDTELQAPFYDARWYEDADLLIASDYDYGRYILEPDRYRDILPFYDSLRGRWTLVSEIRPTEGRDGPTLWLYQPPAAKSGRFEASMIEKLRNTEDGNRRGNFLNELGIVLMKKGRLEKSEQVLETLLSFEQTNLLARNALVQVLFERGRYEKVLEQSAIALAADPNQAGMFDLAGRSLLALKKHTEAEAVLRHAIELNRRQSTSYDALDELYRQKKNDLKRYALLQQYLSILPMGSGKSMQIVGELQALGAGRATRSR